LFIVPAFTTYILVPQVLEQLQFSVGSFRKNRCAERLHDLLDRHGLVGELVLGRAGMSVSKGLVVTNPTPNSPYETKSTHANWLQVGVPGMW